jgi:hypothetical protein
MRVTPGWASYLTPQFTSVDNPSARWCAGIGLNERDVELMDNPSTMPPADLRCDCAFEIARPAGEDDLAMLFEQSMVAG